MNEVHEDVAGALQDAGVDVERLAARGGLATGAAQAVRALSEASGTLLLVRTLSPADFGLVEMIVAVTGVFDLLKDFGLSTVTTQRARMTRAEVSALFWVNLSIGAALTLVMFVLSPVLALAYDRPELLTLALALSSSSLIGALPLQHQALLRRKLAFAALGIIDVSASVAATTCALGAAWSGLGAWALVVRQLVKLGVSAALSFAFQRFRPERPRRIDIRELIRAGTHLSGFQIMNYLERNLDNVLIGRFVGAEALGFYAKGYELMRLPLNHVNGPVGGVAMPMLSRLVHDPQRYTAAYVTLMRVLALATMPCAPLLYFGADRFVPLVLGSQWAQAIPIVQALSLTLLVKPLCHSTSWLLVSQGRTGELMRWGGVGGGLALMSFAFGLPWGASGVAVSYAIMDIVVRAPLLLWWTGRTGPVSTRALVSAGLPAWTLCAGTSAASWLARGGSYGGARGSEELTLVACWLTGVLLLSVSPWGRVVGGDLRRIRSALSSAS